MNNMFFSVRRRSFVLLFILTTVLFFYSTNDLKADYGDSAFGVAFHGGYPNNIGGILRFKFDNVPVMFGVSLSSPYYFVDDFLRVGAVADWWAFNPNVIGSLHFYVGPGVGLLFNIKNDKENFDLSLDFRVPVGFSLVFGQLEIYAEVAPAARFFLKYASSDSPIIIPNSVEDLFAVTGEAGIRLWF